MVEPAVTEKNSLAERYFIIGLMIVNVLIAPLCVYYFSGQVSNDLALAQTELSNLTAEQSRLDIERTLLSQESQQAMTLANSITARESVLTIIEKTIPTIGTRIDVSKGESVFSATFTVRNESSINVECEIPEISLHHESGDGLGIDPVNLYEGKVASEIGILAPGATYQTIWSTGGNGRTYWFKLGVNCKPLPFRVVEVMKMASEAKIDLDGINFLFSKEIWSSSKIAK